jgi:hypothetical protein
MLILEMSLNISRWQMKLYAGKGTEYWWFKHIRVCDKPSWLYSWSCNSRTHLWTSFHGLMEFQTVSNVFFKWFSSKYFALYPISLISNCSNHWLFTPFELKNSTTKLFNSMFNLSLSFSLTKSFTDNHRAIYFAQIICFPLINS